MAHFHATHMFYIVLCGNVLLFKTSSILYFLGCFTFSLCIFGNMNDLSQVTLGGITKKRIKSRFSKTLGLG